jgi:drug/metabolite transporter (DMT)-like permease
MVPFADRVLHRARITRAAWIGSVLATIGMSLLVGGVDASIHWADVLTIFCAACFALHVVLSAKYSANAPATGLAAIQVFIVGVAAIVPSFYSPPAVMTGKVFGAIAFTALVTTALAFIFLMWGQARVSATEAAVILAFEPVAASITSFVWENERITLTFIAGALLILIAMVLSQLPERA